MRPPDPMLLQAFSLLNAGREQDALALFRQLAARDDPGALATLAELTWSGGLIPRSFAEGRELYQRASDAGHIGCAVYATNLLSSGYVGKGDWAVAMARLRQEATFDAARAEILHLLTRLPLASDGSPATRPAGKVLSESPEIQYFPGAFSHRECEYLLNVGKPDYRRAHVIDEATGVERIDPVRTADETHIHWLIENPLIHAFNKRLGALSGTRADQGEPLQILRYQPGQQYVPHYDYIPGAKNQRILTALLYLNEDYVGGETAFPKIGLTVKGRTGDVLLFRNALPNGRKDALSEHAGLPVIEGVKFLATRWIRAGVHEPT